jgi:hypothetical protein
MAKKPPIVQVPNGPTIVVRPPAPAGPTPAIKEGLQERMKVKEAKELNSEKLEHIENTANKLK